MKSNYDRSKTIVCKTTKNYHLHADNLLLIICRKKRLKAIYQLCTENLPYPTDWSIIFSCLSLKIAKLAFHWRWIFPFVAGLHVRVTLMALPFVKWSTALSHKTTFFFLFWPGHSQKNAFSKRVKKKSIIILHCVSKEYIFIIATPKITGNQVKSYNVRVVDRGVGWGQGEIVFEGYWLRSIIKKLNECMNFLSQQGIISKIWGFYF